MKIELKNLEKMKNISIFRATLALILFIFIILLVINQQSVQFFYNGFQNVLKSDLQVYFLDVGQASATLVIFPDDKSLLIDTGSVESANDFVSDVDFLLNKNNLKEIDLLILTHPDADHVGGTAALLDAFQVNNIYRPKVLSSDEKSDLDYNVSTTLTYKNTIQAINNEPNCQISFIEDKEFYCQDYSLQIFAANKDNYTDTNSYSPYILLTMTNRTFLFTGDATKEREEELLADFSDKNYSISVDFLQVAHHGSQYSSLPNFLQTISPRYAFISAQDSAHPSLEVVQRLRDVGVENIYITKNDGMIGVGVSQGGYFVICTLKVWVDIPLLVVFATCVLFVLLKFLDKPTKRQFSAATK